MAHETKVEMQRIARAAHAIAGAIYEDCTSGTVAERIRACIAWENQGTDGGLTDKDRADLADLLDDATAYRVAFAKTDGSWDFVETFRADNDAAANAYAEQHYADQEWYVLDANGQNINA